MVAFVYPIFSWKAGSYNAVAISVESIINCFPMLRANLSRVRTLPMVKLTGVWYPLDNLLYRWYALSPGLIA